VKLRVEDFSFLLETSNLQCTILIIPCSWKSLLQETYPLVSRGIVSSTQMKGVRKQYELTIIARYDDELGSGICPMFMRSMCTYLKAMLFKIRVEYHCVWDLFV
jgi:hypothetical protein